MIEGSVAGLILMLLDSLPGIALSSIEDQAL